MKEETEKKESSKEIQPNKIDKNVTPLIAKDSKWTGIRFQTVATSGNCTADEAEIQCIDHDSEETPPLMVLFPELDKDAEFKELIENNGSTTNITKMLVGKKPDLSLLRKNGELLSGKKPLPSLTESSASDVRISKKGKRKKKRVEKPQEYKSGNETDESDM